MSATADSTANYVFIEKHMILRPAVPLEQLLATQPGLNALLNYIRIHLWRDNLNDTLRVFLSLQQSGHVMHRITRDLRRYLFQPNEWV